MQITPYDPLRILTVRDQVPVLKRGQAGRPSMLLLYPSMTCQQACPYCHDLWRHSPKAFMPTSVIRDVLADAYQIGCRGVELCGGGEPLLHPDLLDWLAYGHDLGVRFGVLTNGAIKNEVLMTLMARQFAYVRVSLDYADRDAYCRERATSSKQYELVCENLRQLIAWRNEGQSECLISLKATVWHQTPQEICDLVQFGRDLGVDSVQFKMCDQVSESLRDDPWRLREIEAVLIREQTYQRAMADIRPRLVWNFGHASLTHRCWITSIHVFVSTDGAVELCCYGHGRHETHTIGNVTQVRLRDLWGSAAHLRAMAQSDPDVCNQFTCRFIDKMAVLDQAEQDGQLEFV